MFLKAFLVISIAALSISGLPAGSELEIPNNRDVVDDIGEILYDIHESLKGLVADGKTHIKSYIENVVELSENALAEAKIDLQKYIVLIYADLQKLQDKIVLVDDEMKVCVVENLYLVKELLEMAKTDLIECVNSGAAEGKEIAEKSLQTINDSQQVIVGLLSKIQQCEDKACKVESIRKGVQETANLEAKIDKINGELLRTTLPEFQACLKEKVKGWRAGAMAILKTVGTCIRDKIEN